MGNSLAQQPKLVIDDKGIKSQKTQNWDKSVKWENLNSNSLIKNNIQIQYRHSGAYDKIHLPFYTRSQYEQIEQKLKETTLKLD